MRKIRARMIAFARVRRPALSSSDASVPAGEDERWEWPSQRAAAGSARNRMRVSSGCLLGPARWRSLLCQYGVSLSYLDSSASTTRRCCRRLISSTSAARLSPPASASPTTPPLASRLATSPSASSSQSARPILRLLRLHVPIFQQLQIEEALLRLSPHSYLVVNTQPPTTQPSIVLGISGRPELWLNIPDVRQRDIRCMRRFTGGGTVYCDSNTFFITLLLARAAVPHLQPYPQPLLEYTSRLYAPVFDALSGGREDGFNVRGNDYCFGQRKFAGNAQSITRDKLLHHTSFLYTVDTLTLTQLLLMPPTSRRPAYRADRPHSEFVTSVAEWMGAGEGEIMSVVDGLGEGLVGELERQGWEVVKESEVEARQWMAGKYDRVLKLIDWDQEMARIEREQADKLAKERATAG